MVRNKPYTGLSPLLTSLAVHVRVILLEVSGLCAGALAVTAREQSELNNLPDEKDMLKIISFPVCQQLSDNIIGKESFLSRNATKMFFKKLKKKLR